jgi:hypothetical protein
MRIASANFIRLILVIVDVVWLKFTFAAFFCTGRSLFSEVLIVLIVACCLFYRFDIFGSGCILANMQHSSPISTGCLICNSLPLPISSFVMFIQNISLCGSIEFYNNNNNKLFVLRG